MHFGIYLVQKGVIDADQFVVALTQQLSEVIPLGQMAVREDVLTMRDVFAIMRAQGDIPPSRFGEIAVNLGFMTHSRLAELLMLQSELKRLISKILVEQKVLSEHDAVQKMSEFRRHCERSGPPGATVKTPDPKKQTIPA